jgi:hypothetical protein
MSDGILDALSLLSMLNDDERWWVVFEEKKDRWE